jgi:hypothetical protein
MAYKSPALAVAAEGAEAAEVAAAAEAADAVEAAATAPTEVVACPGELAAFARLDGFPVTLTNTATTQVIMAGSDKIDPADPCWLGCAC